jgi:hypothetical protein
MRSRWIVLLLSPIGLLLLSAFRLLVISDYNTTTAITIAESGGYVNTLLGSVIPLLPVFIPYLALILLLAEQYTLTIIAFAFTVFISPTPLKLPFTEHLAELDEHALLQVGAGHQMTTIAIFVVAVVLAALYHRSLAEGVSMMAVLYVALALAAGPFLIDPGAWKSLGSAFRGEHRFFGWIPHNSSQITTAVAVIGGILLLLIILSGFLASSGVNLSDITGAAVAGTGKLLAVTVAIAAAVAFFPYVYNIYPPPKRADYYITALRQPWLQTERITVTSGHVYIGYVLSTADYWFTILQAKSRTIVYVRDADVLSREVCQLKLHHQARRHSPLIPIFYTRPPHIESCHRPRQSAAPDSQDSRKAVEHG